jgi:hypothetical protein
VGAVVLGLQGVHLDARGHRPDGATDVAFGPRPVHRIERFRSNYAFELEPPIGIEPMTYALRVRRSDRLS